MASPNTLAAREWWSDRAALLWHPRLAKIRGLDPDDKKTRAKYDLPGPRSNFGKPLLHPTPGRDRSLRGKARRKAAREERQEVRRINEMLDQQHALDEAAQPSPEQLREAAERAEKRERRSAAAKKGAATRKRLEAERARMARDETL